MHLLFVIIIIIIFIIIVWIDLYVFIPFDRAFPKTLVFVSRKSTADHLVEQLLNEASYNRCFLLLNSACVHVLWHCSVLHNNMWFACTSRRRCYCLLSYPFASVVPTFVFSLVTLFM